MASKYDPSKYVRRVLLVHALLLLGVVGIVFLAGRSIYRSTEQQAILQAQASQALVAAQTSAAVRNHFAGILDTLDLLRRSDMEDAAGDPGAGTPPAGQSAGLSAGPSASPSAVPERPERGGRVIGMRLLAPVLWEQLRGRVSDLVVYDRGEGRILRMFAEPGEPTVDDLLREAATWIASVREPTVSGLYGPPGFRVVIAAAPVGRGALGPAAGPAVADGPVVLAVVPRRSIATMFLRGVNQQRRAANSVVQAAGVIDVGQVDNVTGVIVPPTPTVGADAPPDVLSGVTLLDDNGTILGAPDPALVGLSMLSDVADPDFQDRVRRYLDQKIPQQAVVRSPLELGEFRLDAAVVAVHPVPVGDRTWYVLNVSGLADVNRVIDDTFAQATRWAAFVIVALSAILVSTAYQTIKAKRRVETMRTALIDKELDQARKIQLDWLPPPRGEGHGLKIVAVNEPASHISGDFYDWFDLPDGRTALTIGDVTGHGMAAAFLMATCQLLVRNAMVQNQDPGKTLEEVNRQLCSQQFTGQFVTLMVMIVDPSTGRMQVACAGHPPPLIGDADAGFRPMDVQAELVLGIESDMDFPTQTVDLPPGSCLLLYTDGVTEAEAPDGERYSTELLAASLDRTIDTADELARAVRAAVDDFREGQPIADDLTYVAVHLEQAREATPEREPAGELATAS